MRISDWSSDVCSSDLRGAQTDRGIESCGLDADPGDRGGEPALGLPDIRPPPDQSCAIAGRDRPIERGYRCTIDKIRRIVLRGSPQQHREPINLVATRGGIAGPRRHTLGEKGAGPEKRPEGEKRG